MKLCLSPAAVAACNAVLSGTNVHMVSRGSFKRVQQAIGPLSLEAEGRVTFSYGEIELETADLEWLKMSADAIAAWPGPIVGMGGDEALKAALTELLKPNTEGSDAKG